MPDAITVALISGRSVQIPASFESPLSDVKLRAQSSLQTGWGVLQDSRGQILDEEETVRKAGLKPGDVLTFIQLQTVVAGSRFSFAAIAWRWHGYYLG